MGDVKNYIENLTVDPRCWNYTIRCVKCNNELQKTSSFKKENGWHEFSKAMNQKASDHVFHYCALCLRMSKHEYISYELTK